MGCSMQAISVYVNELQADQTKKKQDKFYLDGFYLQLQIRATVISLVDGKNIRNKRFINWNDNDIQTTSEGPPSWQLGPY